MPATAAWVEELAFRDDLVKYVTVLCRRWHVRRADVDDLVQEVFTEIIASLATFQPEKGDFGKWARGIARNVIRHYVRKAERHVRRFSEYHPDADEHAAPEPSPERCAQRRQARCAIANAAERVNEQEVNVLVLHAVDGMSHADVGEELGISEAMSQKCFQRARKQMAQCVDREILSVMPALVMGCDEPTSTNQAVPRWHEGSHYGGQMAAAVVAFLLFIPSNRMPVSHASIEGKIQTGALAEKSSLCQCDKQSYERDEPTVLHDAPIGKPEPASLPSVRVVSAPTRVVDKPTPFTESMSLPTYKHTPRPSVNRPRGR